MTATKNHAATSRPRHGGRDAQGATATATPKGATATTGTTSRARRGHDMHGHDRIQRNVPARYHTTRQNTIVQTYQRCTMQQTPPVGECPPGAKSKAAGSLVLTLNARWNIFGLPVTYEVFTYLVVATVSAPYILCIMFLGLMLMVVERSSGPHRYLAAITHCA
jgi:hypothetical protein